jgi:hypothetical protein
MEPSGDALDLRRIVELLRPATGGARDRASDIDADACSPLRRFTPGRSRLARSITPLYDGSDAGGRGRPVSKFAGCASEPRPGGALARALFRRRAVSRRMDWSRLVLARSRSRSRCESFLGGPSHLHSRTMGRLAVVLTGLNGFSSERSGPRSGSGSARGGWTLRSPQLRIALGASRVGRDADPQQGAGHVFRFDGVGGCGRASAVAGDNPGVSRGSGAAQQGDAVPT